MEKEQEQELEWTKAQKIGISVDLVAAAKQQLEFLAAVDRNRYLYEGPALQRAMYRYNACWLPLLAKHSESQVSEGPLVVPLDCEWIWHCHRLNPVRYKTDCEELYGKILDNSNVVSSVQDSCQSKTEEIWNSQYPAEPYNFNLQNTMSDDLSKRISKLDKCTKYDLVSAVKRQCPFFYQVSLPHMNHDLYLEGAASRYKGFLHLIKSNNEKSLRRFCVPTYDIDLMWHTHQLHPVSYCKDLHELLGKVLEHDDMDSDRTKGKKLDTGFSGTTKQWEDAFGTRYWRAGAMYRGSAPSPLTTTPYQSTIISKDATASPDYQKVIELPEVKAVEGLLEFLEVRNLPEEHKGILFASFSKTTPDIFLHVKRRLSIFSMFGEKQVASFQCEPTGELLFELMSRSPSTIPMKRAYKTLGSASFSLQDCLFPPSKLYEEKWLEMVPSSKLGNLKPIYLRFAISFTIPSIAEHTLHIIRSRPFSKGSCFFPFAGKNQDAKSWTQVIDETGSEVLRLQMRDAEKEKVKGITVPRKEVVGITKSGKISTLAEFLGTGWCLIDSHWSLLREKTSEGYLFLLKGKKMVKFFPGRKLEYEPKKQTTEDKTETQFMTLVEFSAEDPYGKAVALLDLKSGCIKVKEESITVPGIILAFILSDNLKKERCDGFSVNAAEMGSVGEEIIENPEESKGTNFSSSGASEVKLKCEVVEGNALMSQKGGGCGGGCGGECGSGCGNATRTASSGGCGSGCGGGCGNMEKSSGCGSGCSGGCGNLVNSGGCGSGCSGGCGNLVNSGGCGSGCSGGCGNLVNSGGCGSGCSGGCGNLVNSGGYGSGCGGGCGSGCGSGCGGGCRNMEKSSGCGSGCSGGCGNLVNSGGCGSGCGNMLKSGGCGGCSGCGGGCGNMEKSSGCGSGCSGGCGNLVNSGGCGSGCGGGCGVKSGGCGGCGGGGCGNMLKSGGCGGCGSGSGSFFKSDACHENASGNSCAEDQPKAVVV